MSDRNLKIRDLRQDYKSSFLLEKEVDTDPFKQFSKWFDNAISAKVLEPNAMTLATASKEGLPSARIVLLKDFNEYGFTFYTNFNSYKAQQLEKNPLAALIFFWGDLERQIRIEGVVEKINSTEAEGYFQSRPKGSQLGAWVSPQSEVIPDRSFLEKTLEELSEKYKNKEVPKPEHWGGYRVIPNAIEFWQGRSNRLHDRLLYTQNKDKSWKLIRLAP